MTADSLRNDLGALAASLWAELGVGTSTRHHRKWLLDPEPLIVLTCWIGDTDHALREGATEWCIAFGSWLSATRLTNLLSHASKDTQTHFGRLAATVCAHSGLRWRQATVPRPRSAARLKLVSFDAPSLASLRMRGVFGVGARSEVIRVLVGSPNAQHTASDLVDDVGYKKRQVADALESLRWAGLLSMNRQGNRHRYRLRDHHRCANLLADLPELFPRWTHILPLLSRLAEEAAHLRQIPSKERNARASKLARVWAPAVGAARLPLPPLPGSQPRFAEVFERWLERLVDELAYGKPFAGL